MTALLAVSGLAINFGGLAALSGLDLDVGEGEIVALIGPNGAGKTTVFNVISGLYQPSAGRVAFRGEDLVGLPPHAICRRGIARTFQNTEIFRRLSCLDNVLVGRHAHGRGGVIGGALGLPAVRREEQAARRTARELLALMGLGDVVDVEAGNLPLGHQKRLEMARALAAEPTLLLLDEPAGGLNPTETQALMALIRRLRDERRLTILLVEHDMSLVMGVSDRVAVLDHGRKIADGTPQAVARDASVVAAYLGRDDA